MSLYQLFDRIQKGVDKGATKDKSKDTESSRRLRKRALVSDDDDEDIHELECKESASDGNEGDEGGDDDGWDPTLVGRFPLTQTPNWNNDSDEEEVPLSQPREELPPASQDVDAVGIEIDNAVTSHARHIPPLSVFRINTSFWLLDGDLEAHRDEAVRSCLICAHCGIVWWCCEGGWEGGGLDVHTRQIPYYNTDWVDMKWFCSAHISPECVFLADTFVNPWLCVMTHG